MRHARLWHVLLYVGFWESVLAEFVSGGVWRLRLVTHGFWWLEGLSTIHVLYWWFCSWREQECLRSFFSCLWFVEDSFVYWLSCQIWTLSSTITSPYTSVWSRRVIQRILGGKYRWLCISVVLERRLLTTIKVMSLQESCWSSIVDLRFGSKTFSVARNATQARN
jgi:hypothetical protein